MYSREVDGQAEPLNFGVSGKLIMNVLVMYDRETNSLWSQIIGEAVQGDLTGAKLTPLSALQTTWGEWKDLHPNSLALDKGRSGSVDPYNSYYARDVAGVVGETRIDPRLQRKALGLGMILDGQAAYYPFGALRDEIVVNDTVGEIDLVVAFQANATTAVAFDRTVDGQTLTFSPEEQAEDGAGNLVLVDSETGSRWSALSGTAMEGPLAGTALTRIPATTSFWFGWKDWHPETYLYQFIR